MRNNDRKESENVDEVDNLIERLAIHIQSIISSREGSDAEIVENTKALAELVSARAMYFQKPCKESVEQGVMRAVLSVIQGIGNCNTGEKTTVERGEREYEDSVNRMPCGIVGCKLHFENDSRCPFTIHQRNRRNPR